MTQRQVENVGWKLAQHWKRVEARNPMGLTESWIKHALLMDGVFATPRTLKRMHLFVTGEVAERKSLGLWEAGK